MDRSATTNRNYKLPLNKNQKQKGLLDEVVVDMLKDVSIDLNEPKQQQRYFSKNNKQKTTTIMPQTLPRQNATTTIEKNPLSNAFETINQERLNPSRVEAIQHMFEGGLQGKTN